MKKSDELTNLRCVAEAARKINIIDHDAENTQAVIGYEELMDLFAALRELKNEKEN